jgi:hypothetical protein
MEKIELKITPLKPASMAIKRFLLSFSLFRLKGEYKEFNLYFDSLKTILNESNISDCDVCIFIDDSVLYYKPFKEWAKSELPKLPHVFIMHFDCPNFKNGDYHQGLFGSLIRFYALTDKFQKISNPNPKTEYRKYEAVYLSDTDLFPYSINQDYILNMLQHKAHISFETKVHLSKETLEFPIITSTFISSNYFPLHLLTSFLSNLQNKKFDDETLSNFQINLKTTSRRHKTSSYSKSISKSKSITSDSKTIARGYAHFNDDVFYANGIDEFFANHVLLEYFRKFNKKCLVNLNPFISNLPHLFPDFVSSNHFSIDDFEKIKTEPVLNTLVFRKKLIVYFKELYDYCIENNFHKVLDYRESIIKAALYLKYVHNDLLVYFLIPITVFDTSKLTKKEKQMDYGLIINFNNKELDDFETCPNLETLSTNPHNYTDWLYVDRYDFFESSDFSPQAEKLKLIYSKKGYKKGVGITTKTINSLRNWIQRTTGKRIVFLNIFGSLFHFKDIYAPQFLKRKTVDSTKELLETFFNHYKTMGGEKDWKYFSDIKPIHLIEYLCAGKTNLSLVLDFFKLIKKNDVEVVFMSNSFSIDLGLELFKELFSFLIPKFEIFFVGKDFVYNKFNRIMDSPYSTLCDYESNHIFDYVLI